MAPRSAGRSIAKRHDSLDLDGDIVRQRAQAHGGPRVPSHIAEHLDKQAAGKAVKPFSWGCGIQL